jgi:hypothetical protein
MAIVSKAAVSTVSTFGFSCLAAFRTALGRVGVTSRVELFLFLNCKRKSVVAVITGECLVLKTHGTASSLNHLVRAWVIQYLI